MTKRPPRCGANSQGCQPAKRSTHGTPKPPRSRQRPRTRYAPWNGSTATKCLVVCGPSGTGKSHLSRRSGHLAIDKGRIVAWHTLETLAVLVRRHRADDCINKAIAKLIRADLILIDLSDMGTMPTSRAMRISERRRWAASGVSRRGGGIVSGDRRRLRETLDRDQLKHPPLRVRRADAQNDRHRDRRPAHAPRPHPHHRCVWAISSNVYGCSP